MNIADLKKEVREINTANGWHDGDNQPTPGELAMLIVTEVAEMFEWIRKGDSAASDHIAGFSGEEEELADIVIRCVDYADRFGMDLEGVIRAKLDFNRGRGYRHGGKKL